MSEEQKKQVERICVSVDKLDAAKKETVLAYMQGMAAGAKLAAIEKQAEATNSLNDGGEL